MYERDEEFDLETMAEGWDGSDFKPRPQRATTDRESPQPLRPKPIAAGTTVTLSKLIERGWSLSEVDTAVADGVLRHCSGKAAYLTNKELY